MPKPNRQTIHNRQQEKRKEVLQAALEDAVYQELVWLRRNVVGKLHRFKLQKAAPGDLEKAEWKEDEHPRAADGKFGDKSAGSGGTKGDGGGTAGDSGGTAGGGDKAKDKPKEEKAEKPAEKPKAKLTFTPNTFITPYQEDSANVVYESAKHELLMQMINNKYDSKDTLKASIILNNSLTFDNTFNMMDDKDDFWVKIFGDSEAVKEWKDKVDAHAQSVKPKDKPKNKVEGDWGEIEIPKTLEVSKPLEIDEDMIDPSSVKDNKSLDTYLQRTNKYMNKELVKGTSWVTNNADVDNPDELGRFKKEIVDEIAERTGIKKDSVNKFIQSWAGTSNDSNINSLTIQKRAAELFGTKLSDWQQGKYNDAVGEGKPADWSDADIDKMLTAMYQHTQEQFKAAGITSVKMVRGIEYKGRKRDYVSDKAAWEAEIINKPFRDHIEQTWKAKEELTITGNVLESWSSRYDIAHGFCMNNGYAIAMDVPVSRIIGSARTGFGCLPEHEFVVLGGIEDSVNVVYHHSEYDLFSEH